ncbi:unnamed protein product, partial [Rotaria magnacalcarata]
MTTQTKWPHLIGKDGDEAVEILKSEGMEPRKLLQGMCGLSRADTENPKFLIVNVDQDNKNVVFVIVKDIALYLQFTIFDFSTKLKIS